MKYKKDYPEWGNYRSIIGSCYPKNTTNYYERNNIEVCSRWLGKDGFWNFLEDVGPKPSPDHKLYRKDTKGNYEPNNCKWSKVPLKKASPKQQKSRPHFFYNNKKYTIASFCREFGLVYDRTRYRLSSGWDIEDVINAPNQHEQKTRKSSFFNKVLDK